MADPASPSHRVIAVTVALSMVLLAAIGGIAWFTAPTPPTVTRGYATSAGNCTGPYCPAIIVGEATLPSSVTVSVRWNDVTGGQALLSYWGPTSVRWTGCGTSGSTGDCSFVSEAGNYTFGATSSPNYYGQTVDYTITFPAPP
jgi:hypothetical protein